MIPQRTPSRPSSNAAAVALLLALSTCARSVGVAAADDGFREVVREVGYGEGAGDTDVADDMQLFPKIAAKDGRRDLGGGNGKAKGGNGGGVAKQKKTGGNGANGAGGAQKKVGQQQGQVAPSEGEDDVDDPADDVVAIVRFSDERGRGWAKKRSKRVVHDLSRYGLLGVQLSRGQMKQLRNDEGIVDVSLDHDVWTIPDDPAELGPPEKLGGGLYGDRRRALRPDKEEEEEEEIRRAELRRRAAEQVPWGIEAVQAGSGGARPGDFASDIKICVVDTGYDAGHEDLPNRPIVKGSTIYFDGTKPWYEDVQGHGTHVAGTIAAKGDNGIGVPGVVRNAASSSGSIQLHIAKGLNDQGSGSAAGVMDAVRACVDNGARIVSMSLGCSNCFYSSVDSFYRQVYQDDGVLVVAAAGNDGNNNKGYPASYSPVMSVAALKSDWGLASFSQTNDQVEISGPGVGVLSTTPEDGYRSFSGTSMATPHVSAVAALVWSHNSACTARQIRLILDASARRKSSSDPFCDIQYGYGMVQAHDAIDMLKSGGCDAGSATLLDSDGEYDGCAPAPPVEDECDAADRVVFTLVLYTDDYASETSYELSLSDGGGRLASGGGSFNDYTQYNINVNVCVGKSYVFVLEDSYGDGICCRWGEGWYRLTVDGVEIASGGEFDFAATHSFVAQRAVAGPPPTPAPVPTEAPTFVPTKAPVTSSPTSVPTESPSAEPSSRPSAEPTAAPTSSPSGTPSEMPTGVPTGSPEGGDDGPETTPSATTTTTTATDAPPNDDTGEPSAIPSSSPSASPSESPTGSPDDGGDPPSNGCADGEMKVIVEVTTDSWPQETTWEIVSRSTDETITSGGPYAARGTKYTQEMCLPLGVYEFGIDDTYGDGILNGGGYVVYVDGETEASGSNFGYGHKRMFGRCPPGSKAWRIDLRTDWYGSETTWALAARSSSGSATLLRSGGPYRGGSSRLYQDMTCLPDDGGGCYEFGIYDAWGDGICCSYGEGWFEVAYGSEVVLSGGAFGSREEITFGYCSSGSSAAGVAAPDAGGEGTDLGALAAKGERPSKKNGKKIKNAAEKATEFERAKAKAERDEAAKVQKKMEEIAGGQGQGQGKDDGRKRLHKNNPKKADTKLRR